ILNEGRADRYPVRRPGYPAGQGQDALLGRRIPAAMRDRQQDPGALLPGLTRPRRLWPGWVDGPASHCGAWVAGTTPVNINWNARAQLAQRHEPASGASG